MLSDTLAPYHFKKLENRMETAAVIRTTISSLIAGAFFGLSASASLADPIPIESFAKVPNIQSVSMSADGQNLVAIIAAPGSDNEDTALATWDLEALDQGPTITPSGDRMKFIAANA